MPADSDKVTPNNTPNSNKSSPLLNNSLNQSEQIDLHAANKKDSLAKLLSGLDDTQRQAVCTEANPVAILAGAGSGKTRVLTTRIAYRIINEALLPEHVMAVTFTRKAANELGSRLRKMGQSSPCVTGTFHALAYRQFHEFYASRMQGRQAPKLENKKFAMIARAIGGGKQLQKSHILDVLAELDWIRARDLSFAEYEKVHEKHNRRPPLAIEQLNEVAFRYAKDKQRANIVDFDDLIEHNINFLEGDNEFANAIRWRHRYLFVDEFQDVNPMQFRLLQLWVGQYPDLCVVGDPHQAIYGWNGADSQYLNYFNKHFQGSETIRLGYNYRSTPSIIRAAHDVLPATNPPAPLPKTTREDGPPIQVTGYPDGDTEADAIARELRKNHSNVMRWTDQAVLVRTNALATLIGTHLARRQIPYLLSGGKNLFDESEVVELLLAINKIEVPLKDAISDLMQMADEAYDEALQKAARLARREKFASANRANRTPRYNPDAETTDPDDGFDSLDEDSSGVTLSPAELERHENRLALIDMAVDFDKTTSDATNFQFLNWARDLRRSQWSNESVTSTKRDVVSVMTFHAAKGLEFKNVFIAACESGTVPISQAKTPQARSEERRLIHVAVTRAKDRCFVSFAERRKFGDQTRRRTPSPYIEDLIQGYQLKRDLNGLLVSRIDTQDARANSKTEDDTEARIKDLRQRRESRREAPIDSPLYRDLAEWRTATAKEIEKPAYVVFNNATLVEIAQQHPTSLQELADIKGVGPVKLLKYGEEIIDLINSR